VSNDHQFNVLFLCTGNSARSILAEAILNDFGNGKFVAYSAGSKPKSNPHPKTIEILETNNFDTNNLRSKSWDEFSLADSPKIDLVITVCSNAANESCPIFVGTPKSMHWDIDDPAREFDSDEDQTHEFKIVFNELKQRIKKLIQSIDTRHF
jgi:arsenate reductase (thioredoxin)